MKSFLTCLVVLLHVAAVPFSANALSSFSYTIAVDAVANGGGSQSSSSYRLSGLAGQPLAVGPVSSAGFTVQGGYYFILTLEELLGKKNTALVYDSAALYAGFDGAGIWKSTDDGATWNAAATQPANRQIRGLVIHPTARATLYAATYGDGIFMSSDSGDSWGACAGQPANLNAVSLTIDPTGRLYAGTEGGIFSSSDCTAWSAVNTGLTVDATKPVVSLAIDLATSATIYAGLDGGGIFKTTNSGASWSPASGQPTNLRVKELVINLGDGTKLFAATYGGGVFISTDSGDHWSACANTNLTNLKLSSLTIDAGGKLYAGTEGGVFVSSDDCATWTERNAGLP